MTEAHSRLLAPSAAHRWFSCPGSSQAASRYRDEPGEAAMEGTAMHWLLERCLVDGDDAAGYLGRTLSVTEKQVTRTFVVNRDMARDVQLCVDAAREIVATPGESRVEAEVRLDYIHPELFGRTDVWHWGDDNLLTVFDAKFGRVDVDPIDNEQLLIYALGVYRAYADFVYYNQGHRHLERVRLVIAQPRSLAPVPRVKTWEFPVVDLERFEIDALWPAVRDVVDAAGPDVFRMGPWCENCAALGECPATKEAKQDLAALVYASEVTPAVAGRLLALKTLSDAQFKKAEAVALDALLRGQDVTGFGLFTSRKHRQWRDEEQAKDALIEACGVGALAPPTPAQAEKLGADAKRVVEQLAHTPPGDPVVAPKGDKRAPYVARSAVEMFRDSVKAAS